MFSEVVKLYCMICWSSGYSFDILVVMEARTAALVTIFRKKKERKEKPQMFFVILLEYILWSGFCKETLSNQWCCMQSTLSNTYTHNTAQYTHLNPHPPIHLTCVLFVNRTPPSRWLSLILSLKRFPLISSVISCSPAQLSHPEINSGTKNISVRKT